MLVSNTSTLVLLAKVQCLEAFIKTSPPIEIPSQVEKEALFEKDSYYARLIQKLIKDKKIKIVSVNKNQIIKIISQFKLDEGEAATYALFNNKEHEAVLTDDGELIKLCKLEKMPFICAMAVVIRLFEKKRLSKAETINKLEKLHLVGRYSKELYEHFKSEVK
jgi:predicted nucleic acid-binding protein